MTAATASRRLKAAAAALRRGSAAVALDIIRPAIVEDPRHLNGLILAAMAERTRGSPGAAARMFRRVLALSPGDPHARAGLDEIDPAHQREPATVAALLERARRRPGDVGGWIGLGWAALSGGDGAMAWAALRRACVLAPGDRAAVPLAVLAERRRGSRADWRALAGRALAVGPANPRTLEAALIAFREARDGPGTDRAARKLAVVVPETSNAHQGLSVMADVALRSRDIELATRLVGWAECMEPGAHAHAAVRARLLRSEGRLADAAGYLRARIAEHPSEPTSIGLTFDLASVLDAAGDVAGAGAALVAANRAARQRALEEGADRRRFLRLLDRLAPVAGVARPTGRADGPTPVFLFGIPRSGTTLIGDILHRHRCIETFDERELLPDTVWSEGRRLRAEGVDIADVIAGRRRVGEPDLDGMRTTFRKLMQRQTRHPDRPVKVDKSPFGLLYAGLVAQLFPDARIIFALRHPADVCLSCLMQEFASTDPLASFTAVEETADLYDRVMSFWMRARDVFPTAVHTVRYEALVTDPAAEIRRLTDFLGLDWDPGLLDPGRTVGRFTATPSYRQVARPIGGEAIGRWQRYRDYLAPGWPKLEPWIRRLGYADG